MKPKVVRTDKSMYILASQFEHLEAVADVVTTENDEEQTILEAIDGASLIMVSSATITRNILEAGRDLKGVLKWGVGTDSVDITAATELGIPVVHCPHYGPQSIADFAFAMLMAQAKRLFHINRDMRKLGWMYPLPPFVEPTGSYLGIDLPNKTVGLIGFGRIGQVMARRCLGFDMNVLVYDPYQEQNATTFPQVTFVSLDMLLTKADFVSIHVVLTPETEKMLGERELSLLKPTAYLINTARGAVFDQAALVTALKEGRIAGAGLDVFLNEPTGLDNPFLMMDNVIIAPHLASYTREAYETLDKNALQKALAILNDEPLWDVKNPEVFQHKNG